MKLRILAFTLISIISFVVPNSYAQNVPGESYTLVASSANATLVNRGRILWNTGVCTRFALAASCTQAQACAAAVARGIAVPGGASCTAAQARTVDIEIFANSTAGRDLYFTHQQAVKVIIPLLIKAAEEADRTAQAANYKAGNDATKNAMCAAAGPPVPPTVADGCSLFP